MLSAHNHKNDPMEPAASLSHRLTSLTFDEETPSSSSRSASPSRVEATLDSIVDGVKNLIEKVVPQSLVKGHYVIDAFDSLTETVKSDMVDSAKHPEITKLAVVRKDNKIPKEEIEFQKRRKIFMKKAFATYIGVPEDQVELDDIPVIGVAGSGGGYKAMIATSGFMKAMQDDGLFDCVMYISGVSGSCWTLSNFYMAANCSPAGLIEHFKEVLPAHPADPFHILDVLSVNAQERVLTLFGGMMQKKLQGLHRGVVDTYGALMTSHFMSAKDLQWRNDDFKLSQHARFVDQGQNPLPLYTAVRHERPWKSRKFSSSVPTLLSVSSSPSASTTPLGSTSPSTPTSHLAPKDAKQVEYEEGVESGDLPGKLESIEKGESWWQWHEASPFELGSDELRYWIPMWSFGRKFEGGKSVDAVPEQNFALQVGLYGSAMCAPFEVSVETFDRSKASSSFGATLRRKARKLIDPSSPAAIRELLASHPVHASFNWNPLYLLDPDTSSPGLNNSPRIQLIDAGSDNNLPLYPMTREGRGVDIIFAFDSSEDVERNIVTPDVERFGAKKGIKFTLTSPTPPPQPAEVFGKQAEAAAAATLPPMSERYAHRYCQIYDGKAQGGGLGAHGEPLAEQDVTVIYMPVLPNVAKPGYEPGTNTFAKLQYTVQEVSDLAECAGMNWIQEKSNIREAVRAVWEKKRAARLAAVQGT